MKTTIDLPEHLVKEMKLRAVHEGKKLKEVAAELLSKALQLEATAANSLSSPQSERKSTKIAPFLIEGIPLEKASAKELNGQEMSDYLKDLQEKDDHEYAKRTAGR